MEPDDSQSYSDKLDQPSLPQPKESEITLYSSPDKGTSNSVPQQNQDKSQCSYTDQSFFPMLKDIKREQDVDFQGLIHSKNTSGSVFTPGSSHSQQEETIARRERDSLDNEEHLSELTVSFANISNTVKPHFVVPSQSVENRNSIEHVGKAHHKKSMCKSKTNSSKSNENPVDKISDSQSHQIGIPRVSNVVKKLKRMIRQKKDKVNSISNHKVGTKNALSAHADKSPFSSNNKEYFEIKPAQSEVPVQSSSEQQVGLFSENGRKDGKNPLYCKICFQSFDGMERLGEHMKSHSIEECYSIQCMKCKRNFDDRLLLNKHLSDTGCSGFVCSVCNMSFPLETLLLKHQVLAHKVCDEMKCSECGKVFSDQGSWARHEATHVKSAQYVCKICNKMFFTKQGIVTSHLPTCHNIGVQSETKSRSMCDLSAPVSNHKKIVLNNDSSSIGGLPSFVLHSNDGGTLVLTPLRANKSAMETDLKDQEQIKNCPSQIDSTYCKIKPKETFDPSHCKICSQLFLKKEELQEHMATHTVEECCSIQCMKCNTHFDDLASLQKHLNLTKCTGFFCSICQISFGLEAHLLRHNVHFHKKGVTEMKCGHCGKQFPKVGAWARHEANHVKHKQYSCKICNESFSLDVTLQRYHLPKVHGVTLRMKRPDKTKIENEAYAGADAQNEVGTEASSSSSASELFSCRVCSQTHASNDELKAHISSHFIEECFHIQCLKCKVYFEDETLLDKHFRETGCSGFTCSICNASFGLEYSLLKHIVQVHKREEKNMQCEKCGHWLTDFSAWVRHEANHAQSQYECKLCNKRFKTKRPFYDSHMFRMHNIKPHDAKETVANNSKLSYTQALRHEVCVDCDVCGGKVPDQESLASHRIHHFMEGKFKIQCSGCPQTFNEMDDLMNHVQERQCSQYYCDECKKYFSTQYDFVLHRVEKHESILDSGYYKCLDCPKVFDTLSGYVNHAVENHVTVWPFHCAVCNANFKSVDLLKVHLSECHTLIEDDKELGDYKCFKCLASFGTKKGLVNHRRFHQIKRNIVAVQGSSNTDSNPSSYLTPFFCSICLIGFSRADDLDEHTQLHSSQPLEKTECPTCKKVVLKKLLGAHMADHERSVLCTHCGKMLKSPSALKNHNLVCHSGVNPFQCHICHKFLSSAKRLEQHIWLHTGYKPYECKICGKKFTLQNLLESHLASHANKRNYKCHLCDYRCRHKSQLNGHMDKHAGIKRYKCQVCGMQFRTASARKVHTEIHTGEKYDCKICGKKFSTKRYIKSHMRTHTNEKPYTCPKCGASFTMASNLNSHVKRVHGNLVFKQFQEEKMLKKKQNQT
ncbi:zinc finger protein 208 [Elysia marginata]|uniref:Zinc finger protein 208 n=1 Tax=Elysia marginata TaxID=1093978 RepID=A0AAV4G866_9GAST|nr:zinc finger protein 208 [Elysia marginata]